MVVQPDDDLRSMLDSVDPVDLLEIDIITANLITPLNVAAEAHGHGCAAIAAHQQPSLFAALAARHLLAAGVVTAAVIGTGPVATAHLAALAEHVCNISHVAVFPVPPSRLDLEPFSLDVWRSHRISTTVTADLADAVFGANLVVVSDLDDLDPRNLVQGAVVINTSTNRLARVARAASCIVVHDRTPIMHQVDRAVTWSPRCTDWQNDKQVINLRQLVSGTSRAAPDELVLVELVGGGDGVRT